MEPLSKAAYEGDATSLRALIESGGDIHQCSKHDKRSPYGAPFIGRALKAMLNVRKSYWTQERGSMSGTV